MKTLIGLVLNFFRGVCNFIVWGRVIYKDRQYDYAFFWDVLQRKLELMSKDISRGEFEDTEYYKNKIDLCISLIKKIKTDYYMDMYHEYYKADIRFESLDVEECVDRCSNGNGVVDELCMHKCRSLYKLVQSNIEDNLDEYFKKHRSAYKKVINKVGVESAADMNRVTIALYIGNIKHKQAKSLLFKILERDIEKWWI